MNKASKPSEVLLIGSTLYFLKEELVDNSNKISRTSWYDVVTIRVVSATLTEDNKLLVNGDVRRREEQNVFEQKFDVDKPCLYTSKKDAVEDAWMYNSQSLDNNKVAIADKKKELRKKEEEINVTKGQIEAGEEVNEFLENWLERAEEGSTYQRSSE